MLVPKCVTFIFVLCFVQQSLSKPTANYLTEGRGIGSTIWGWITYPFTWWTSGEADQPINDQVTGSTTYGPYENIEIRKHNVTVWCNDQTCTTMRCDAKLGCKNVTCNIYDTDLNGECREYNAIVTSEEPVPAKPTESARPIFNDKVTDPTKTPEVSSAASITSTQKDINSNQSTYEHPLELEAVLSSTVIEGNVEKVSPDDKIETASTKDKV